jgi:Autophagy protein 16 (ATG16)
LRDRNAEGRESRKLVEQVQDEMIGLNLEKNVAEQRAERLERENKELVDRFMEYKKKEAEWMNEESKW